MAEIALNPRHLETVRRLVREHFPNAEVRAFGSRVTGGSRKYSDLDLAIMESTEVDWSRLGRLKEALSRSELPIRVDVLDWYAVSPTFRQIIGQQFVVVQNARASETA